MINLTVAVGLRFVYHNETGVYNEEAQEVIIDCKFDLLNPKHLYEYGKE